MTCTVDVLPDPISTHERGTWLGRAFGQGAARRGITSVAFCESRLSVQRWSEQPCRGTKSPGEQGRGRVPSARQEQRHRQINAIGLVLLACRQRYGLDMLMVVDSEGELLQRGVDPDLTAVGAMVPRLFRRDLHPNEVCREMVARVPSVSALRVVAMPLLFDGQLVFLFAVGEVKLDFEAAMECVTAGIERILMAGRATALPGGP